MGRRLRDEGEGLIGKGKGLRHEGEPKTAPWGKSVQVGILQPGQYTTKGFRRGGGVQSDA